MVYGDRPLGRLLRPVANRVLPAAPRSVRVLSGVGCGIRLVIEPRAEKFYWTGAHEPAVQQQLVRLLRPGSTFWDVGAHIGFFSLIASRIVGHEGRVHAFEPLPENIARLERSLALNEGSANVAIHPWAVADVVGEVPLYPDVSSLMGGLIGGPGVSIVVRGVTLDALANDLGLPDLIKVDVEGAESRVLAGGKQLLAQHSVPLIMEFLASAALEDARVRLPDHRFSPLDNTNWLVTPA
jgi:FkbM family methyltransferase